MKIESIGASPKYCFAMVLYLASTTLLAREFIVYLPDNPSITRPQRIELIRRLDTSLDVAHAQGNGMKLMASGSNVDDHSLSIPGAMLLSISSQNLVDAESRGESERKIKEELERKIRETVQVPTDQKISIVPNYIGRLAQTKRPNDPLYDLQAAQFASIGLEQAWSQRSNAANVTVAVIDSGIYYEHPDLIEQFKQNSDILNKGADFSGASSDEDARAEYTQVRALAQTDDNGDIIGCVAKQRALNLWETHGTIVAGLIGATGNNNKYGTGVAWQTQILPIRIADENCLHLQFTLTDVLEGLRYAIDQGVDIINASFEVRFLGQEDPEEVRVLTDLIEEAEKNGILIVAAAGNEGKDVMDEKIKGFPHSYSNYPNVLIVGSIGNVDDRLAKHSNFGGSSVHVAAPGVEVFSTTLVKTLQHPAPRFNRGDGFLPHSGTSFATPVVSGVAALLKAERPELTPEEIKNIIVSKARKAPELKGLIVGGVIDAESSIAEVTMLSASRITRLASAMIPEQVSQSSDPCQVFRDSHPIRSYQLKEDYELEIDGICEQLDAQIEFAQTQGGARLIVETAKPMSAEALKREVGTDILVEAVPKGKSMNKFDVKTASDVLNPKATLIHRLKEISVEATVKPPSAIGSLRTTE